MVPLRSATTLLGTPALISDCAPMMLRVRPAQLTITAVSFRRFNSSAQRIRSPPGTLMPPGMQNLPNSSGVRMSRITNSAERSCRALSSCGAKSGTFCS